MCYQGGYEDSQVSTTKVGWKSDKLRTDVQRLCYIFGIFRLLHPVSQYPMITVRLNWTTWQKRGATICYNFHTKLLKYFTRTRYGAFRQKNRTEGSNCARRREIGEPMMFLPSVKAGRSMHPLLILNQGITRSIECSKPTCNVLLLHGSINNILWGTSPTVLKAIPFL